MIVNSNFLKHKYQYGIQCFILTVVSFALLSTLKFISSDLVVVSFASTTYIVFCSPHSYRAKMRCIIGGYFIGFICGYCASLFLPSGGGIMMLPCDGCYWHELLGALAIGSSVFFMLFFKCQHPPASAVALSLVIEQWDASTVVVTLVSLCFLLMCRVCLGKYLMELS